MRYFTRKSRLAALLVALPMTLGLLPVQAAEAPLTRGQVRDMLVEAADDYNPGVTAADVLQGRSGGTADEDAAATRVEALVMLTRAFGPLPQLTGDSARTAYPTPDFTDVPAWAEEELEPLFQAGIVTGTGSDSLSPDSPITRSELELLVKRVYALEGSCLQDDFYAAVNHDWLETAQMKDGYSLYGTFEEVEYQTGQQIQGLIQEIVDTQPQDGTPQDRIKTLYENILDWDSRNAQGAAPIQPYMEALENASTLDELMEVHNRISAQLAIPTLLTFSLANDIYHAGQINAVLMTYVPTMDASYYEDPDARAALVTYVSSLFTLAGYSQEQAAQAAQRCLTLEQELAAASLTAEEAADITNTYNVVDAQQLADQFSQIDLDGVLQACGLRAEDNYVISDMGQAAYLAGLLTPEHLEDAKLLAQVGLLTSCASILSRDFLEANEQFNQAILGLSSASDQEAAVSKVEEYLYQDLGPLYVDSCFSSQAKADVTTMVEDIVDVYAQRIWDLDWMSDATKAKAVEKLEAIEIDVGYPDQWTNCLEGVDFRSTDQGGSYFENYVQIGLAQQSHNSEIQDDPSVLDIAWEGVPVYMVNAFYNPFDNAITLPAGILQAPIYDVTASTVENLGGIGFVVAHEITHAFDNQGAMFDAQGAMNNWWTEEDYAAFQDLCQQVAEFYNGQEAAPGIPCNGVLTLSENVADLGAAACITQMLAGEEEADFQALYERVAVLWRSTASREGLIYLTTQDTHAPNKLRVNRVLQSLDQFYQVFDIQPGDGMWLDPQERVKIW